MASFVLVEFPVSSLEPESSCPGFLLLARPAGFVYVIAGPQTGPFSEVV